MIELSLKEKAHYILKDMQKSKTSDILNKINFNEKGMKFILLYLEEHKKISSNLLSEKMNISRARVAVLLTKLKNKGLINKTVSESDARIDIITLTDNGINEIQKMKETVISNLENLITEVGFEEIVKFLEISRKINAAFNKFKEEWVCLNY